MKKYSITLLIICTTFFSAWSMEDKMIQSFSFIRRAMNKDFTQKTTTYKHKVREKIEALKTANIIEYKDYQYNQNSKLDIMNQFFTVYPKRIYPELILILKNINNSFNRKDFITLLPKLKTHNYSLKDFLIANLIELTEKKKIAFNDNEIILMKSCLTIMHYDLTTIYSELLEETAKIINLENATIKAKTTVAKIRTQKEKVTVYDLEQYKDELEELITHLEEQKTSEDILNQYQETVTTITQRIEFLTEKRKI